MARLYSSPPNFSQVPSAIREDRPVYRLRGDIFTDDTLFLKGTTLETDDDYIPNIAMFPVNDLAYKNYVAFLKEYDAKGEEWLTIPIKERQGYMREQPKLPAFLNEWKKVHAFAKAKGLHLVHAIDRSPAILGAPRTGKPSVRPVDMSMIGQLPFEDNTAVGKGNTMDKNSVAAVQSLSA
jgi:hypothetical protein